MDQEYVKFTFEKPRHLVSMKALKRSWQKKYSCPPTKCLGHQLIMPVQTEVDWGFNSSWTSASILTCSQPTTIVYNITCTPGTSITYPVHAYPLATDDNWYSTEQMVSWSMRYNYEHTLRQYMTGMDSLVYSPIDTAEMRAAAEKRSIAAKAAASRADLLLTSLLTQEQAVQYVKDNNFDLRINGKIYRIHRGRAGNVQLIENGKPVAKYCAHPDEWLPDSDNVVAQMMLLKTDEASFLKIANRTSLQ